MVVENVSFHHSFHYGKSNSKKFTDLAYLSDQHFTLLSSLVSDVLEGNSLRGRNKPSWLDQQGNIIPQAKLYQDGNIWHYHVGEHDLTLPAKTPDIYTVNLKGDTGESNLDTTIRRVGILVKTRQELLLRTISQRHLHHFIRATKFNVVEQSSKPNNSLSKNFVVKICT